MDCEVLCILFLKCFAILSFKVIIPYKDITLMPTSNGDKWPWTMIVAVVIGAVFLCLIITIICSIVTVVCRNKKR